MRVVLFFCFVAAFVSCNKEELEPPFSYLEFSNTSCELCDFADSITGTYRGEAYGVTLPGPSLNDSMTMIVEHIFLGNESYADSVIMYFRTLRWYDYDPGGIEENIVQVHSADGSVINPPFTHPDYPSWPYIYTLNPDSIDMHYNGPTGTGGSIPYIHATLYRQ